MSREFIKEIPEHLRHIYDKPAEPDPMRTYFETLKKQEEIKTKARETSILYKLFGDHIFGYMNVDGSLELNINVLDVRELLRTISEEDGKLAAMESELDRIGDGKIKDTIKVRRGEDVQDEEVTFHFDAFKLSTAIGEVRTTFTEAHTDIYKIFSTDGGLYGFPLYDCAYAPKDKYDAFMAARRLVNSVYRPDCPMNHSADQGYHMYFRSTIKILPLIKSIRNIRW